MYEYNVGFLLFRSSLTFYKSLPTASLRTFAPENADKNAVCKLFHPLGREKFLVSLRQKVFEKV